MNIVLRGSHGLISLGEEWLINRIWVQHHDAFTSGDDKLRKLSRCLFSDTSSSLGLDIWLISFHKI